MKFSHRRIVAMFKIQVVLERIISLLRTPIFWLLTIGGNAFVVFGAWLIYVFEGNVNPTASQFIDCLTWGFGLVTTVGGGPLAPATVAGKALSILMMLGGAVFLWSYMALFIGALVGPELRLIEREVDELQKASKRDDVVIEKLREILRHVDEKESHNG